jgi:hypothetical protein
MFGADIQSREDRRDDEKDVEIQNLLGDIPGKVLGSRGAAIENLVRAFKPRPHHVILVHDVDGPGKREAQGNPRQGPEQGRAERGHPGAAVEERQVDGDQADERTQEKKQGPAHGAEGSPPQRPGTVQGTKPRGMARTGQVTPGLAIPGAREAA